MLKHSKIEDAAEATFAGRFSAISVNRRQQSWFDEQEQPILWWQIDDEYKKLILAMVSYLRDNAQRPTTTATIYDVK